MYQTNSNCDVKHQTLGNYCYNPSSKTDIKRRRSTSFNHNNIFFASKNVQLL